MSQGSRGTFLRRRLVCSATCFWISRLMALPMAPMKVGRFAAAHCMLASRFTLSCWKRGVT
jgi:hypothetical protein